jgi:hypothetical protein
MDNHYYYVSGDFGMKNNGSFTKEKRYWMTFMRHEAVAMDKNAIKPYGATKNGAFVGTVTGKPLVYSENPKRLHYIIKAVYAADAFWNLMLEESPVKSGPFDGSCLICAKALIRAADGGELVRIVDSKGMTHHYGALIDGEVYDFDGHHPSPRQWVVRFSELESMMDQDLEFAMGYDETADIPDEPHIEKRLAAIISNTRYEEAKDCDDESNKLATPGCA